MKNLLLLLLTAFTLCCCSKDNDKPKSELEKLPPATQTGANKAGCLVDGKAFIPKGNFPGGAALICNYTDGLNFSLSINENINNNIKTIGVASLNQNLNDNIGTTFQLSEFGANSKFGEYNINSVASPDPNYFKTTSTIVGELVITNHNFSQAILSGTFWFDAINSEGKIVKVREGRFDAHY
jgi:hypothetical protein